VAIDWSKPYAEIHGVHTARYEQDGIYYDLNGKDIYHPKSGKRNKDWARDQKGLGGRNLLIWEAKNLGGIILEKNEKIDSIRRKVMDRLPE